MIPELVRTFIANWHEVTFVATPECPSGQIRNVSLAGEAVTVTGGGAGAGAWVTVTGGGAVTVTGGGGTAVVA